LQKIQNARFGRVYPIGRDDYTREVTEASKASVDEDGNVVSEDRKRDEDDEDDEEDGVGDRKKDKKGGKGTGVVCFLYKDGLPRSERATEHIKILAQRHPHTKFVSIVGDKCIPNLPDTRLPMFIIYRNGDVLNQIVAWGGDRERKIEELEAVLILAGAVIPQARPPPERGNDSDEDEDSEDDDSDREPSSRMRSAATRTNVRPSKNIRQSQKKKDEDSDSDFDI